MKNKRNFVKAAQYVRRIAIIREALFRIGYNKSLKILPDFVECYARDRFDLELTNKIGFDAIDKRNNKYQIKFTILKDRSPSGKNIFCNALDNIRPGKFDFLIAVILNKEYEIVGVYKIPEHFVCKKGNLSENRSFRIAKTIDKLDRYKVSIQ